MEKQLFSPVNKAGAAAFFRSQIIRSIRLLAFHACSIFMKIKQAQTGFYSFGLTPLTEKL